MTTKSGQNFSRFLFTFICCQMMKLLDKASFESASIVLAMKACAMNANRSIKLKFAKRIVTLLEMGALNLPGRYCLCHPTD